MNTVINFTVDGEPVAQGRPRFARIGGYVRTYDPEKSKKYKKIVKDAALNVMQNDLLDGPLMLCVDAYVGIPKSMSKKKRTLAIELSIFPTAKPDLDNIVKCIMDALTGVIWQDDSHVTRIVASKYYSENPRVDIWIREC